MNNRNKKEEAAVAPGQKVIYLSRPFEDYYVGKNMDFNGDPYYVTKVQLHKSKEIEVHLQQGYYANGIEYRKVEK